jgi:hypothetical protein
MCMKCIRKNDRLGLPPKVTYGQVKAVAHSFNRPYGMMAMRADHRFNIGVEAHLQKIIDAKNFAKYRKAKERGNNE